MTFTVAGSIITQANEAGIAITGATSITGGVRFTCTQSYAVGDVIRITGTTNYNGNWIIAAVTGTTFDVLESVTGGSITFVSTQTGTASRGDASLAGLTGLAGVTTTTIDASSGFVVYLLADNVKLQINGTLVIGGARATNSILGEQEMLVLGQNAIGSTQPDWRVGSGGVLTIGRRYTNTVNVAGSGTAPQWSDGVQPQTLIYQKGQYGRAWSNGNAFSSDGGATIGNSAFGAVAQGGTLNWISGTIDCWGGIGLANTSIVNIGFEGMRQKPTIDNRRSGQVFYFYSTSLTIYGLVVIGDRGINSGASQAGFGASVVFSSPPIVLQNYEPRYMYRAVSGSGSMQSCNFTVENYPGAVGSAFDHEKNCAIGQTVNVTYKNCAIGTSLRVLDDVDGNSRLFVTQKLTAVVQTTDGVAIQDAQVWAISLASVQSLGTTDATGTTVIDNIQTGFADSNTAVITLRWPAGDVATFFVRAYGSLSASFLSTLRGVGGTTLSATLITDFAVTLSRTAAAALNAVATLNDFYDAAKYWNVQTSNVNYPTATTQVATAAGTTIDLGTLNIIVDASAATAFAVNTGTNTITIKASTLTNGTKFSLLKTTGTISFANGAIATCALQGIVVRDTTGIYSPVLNNATVRFTSAGTYDLRNATITGTVTFTNTSGGAVTVQLSPTVTFINSGPNITVDNAVSATLTISGIVAGSRLLLRRTDNSAVLINEIVAGTTRAYTYTYTADVPVEIIVRNASGFPAYQEYKVLGTLTLVNSSITVSQQLDE